jgi:hypothetical protein
LYNYKAKENNSKIAILRREMQSNNWLLANFTAKNGSAQKAGEFGKFLLVALVVQSSQ